MIIPPHGLEAIKATFGDPTPYITQAGVEESWMNTILQKIHLPYTMDYAYAKTKIITIQCHKLIAEPLQNTFTEVHNKGLSNLCLVYGGCYVWRQMRTSYKLSTHCWGIALDLNPRTNVQGTKGDMAPEIISIFESHGFYWGGNFKLRDPMHFQYCTGY